MRRSDPPPGHPFERQVKPLVLVLSGPSGAGKDAVLARMRETGLPFEYVTTVTTRARRAREKDGRDYHFVSEVRYREMLAGGELLESAQVYGNWYGVPRQPIREALAAGRDAVVKVDIQGAATLKRIIPQAVFVFLAPSSVEELAERLRQRHTESPLDLALRLKAAEAEMNQVALFDYVVVNRQGGIDEAVAQIQAIITAEKCRVVPREVRL